MRKFKKISAVLSILLAFSISVGTFPLSALAGFYLNEDSILGGYSYNGEIQAPNSSVLSSLGAFGVSLGALPFSESFPNPPSFSDRGNGSWGTSLLEKIFSIVGNNINSNEGPNGRATSCTVSMFSNSSLGIYVSSYDSESGEGWDISCSPIVSVAAQQGALQTSEVLPLAVFEEDTLVTGVDSIQNDPNNVRVTVGVNSTIEAYGAQFQRIDGLSDWVGHITIEPDSEGEFSLSNSDVEKLHDLQLPQGVKIGASSPSNSSSTVRPRNSSIVSVTQPRCTLSSDDDWWSGTNWITDCIAYGLSADGRTGRAEAISETGRSGGFGEFVTIAVGVVGLVVGVGELFLETAFSSLGSIYNLSGLVTGPAGLSTLSGAGAIAVAAMLQAATDGSYGTVEQSIASSVPLGTRNGQWSWAWSELPPPPTILINGSCSSTHNNCSSGTLGATAEYSDQWQWWCNGSNGGGNILCSEMKPSTTPLTICQDPSASNNGGPLPCTYPQGTVPSLPQSVTVTVCSGNAPTWDPSTNSCKSVTPDSFGSWSYPSSCPTACGTPASTQTQVCTGGNGTCSGTPASRQCSATAACSTTQVTSGNTNNTNNTNNQNNTTGNQINQVGGQNQGSQVNNGNPSVTISADPNRVQAGNPSTVSWTLNNVSCNITKNGAQWKSNVSSSGEESPIINGRTTFTISCTDTNGEPVAPQSVTVNITPLYREF